MEKKTTSYSFSSLYKTAFKIDPLLDIRKAESYLALIFSIILTLLLAFIYYNSDTKEFNASLQNILLSIFSGLIGLLGFIIGGLAIISGTTSSKAVSEIDKAGKLGSLLSIMFSFYYIGVVIGFEIFIVLFCYISLVCNFDYIPLFFLLSSFLVSYLFFFTIIYCVSLLKTSINIFLVNFKYSVNK